VCNSSRWYSRGRRERGASTREREKDLFELFLGSTVGRKTLGSEVGSNLFDDEIGGDGDDVSSV